jgi:hypothetical protein
MNLYEISSNRGHTKRVEEPVVVVWNTKLTWNTSLVVVWNYIYVIRSQTPHLSGNVQKIDIRSISVIA